MCNLSPINRLRTVRTFDIPKIESVANAKMSWPDIYQLFKSPDNNLFRNQSEFFSKEKKKLFLD